MRYEAYGFAKSRRENRDDGWLKCFTYAPTVDLQPEMTRLVMRTFSDPIAAVASS